MGYQLKEIQDSHDGHSAREWFALEYARNYGGPNPITPEVTGYKVIPGMTIVDTGEDLVLALEFSQGYDRRRKRNLTALTVAVIVPQHVADVYRTGRVTEAGGLFESVAERSRAVERIRAGECRIWEADILYNQENVSFDDVDVSILPAA